MSKLKMWDAHRNWEDAEATWEAGSAKSADVRPLKQLGTFPKMPGITAETAKHLKWKAFKWMIAKDIGWKLLKQFLRHPFKYGTRLIASLVQNKPYLRDKDLFLYGVKSKEQFAGQIRDPKALLVVGFSYCQKPFECPAGRFTENCISDAEHPVCRQCYIGKCINTLPAEGAVFLLIPTIHYIGEKILSLAHANPNRKLSFLITACEMTLEMFGDLGNMVGATGVGVRLDGRICNTMKAFELSEKGIKPGLTVLQSEAAQQMLSFLQVRRDAVIKSQTTF